MKKNSKRGLRIIAGISTVILMSPLFANSSVQVMLGNELSAHADTHAKTPVGDKSVHKAFTPKRKSQHAIDSSIKYSHKVPVLRVSLKPTNTNYFKKGDQIHFKFSSKNVNLKNLKASYQKSLPFSYKKVSDHELVLTFKKSLNSGLYGQAYAIPTKNKKMTTKVQGTFDKAKLDIKNGHIHSYKFTSRAHKAGSNTATQQNTANQQSTGTNAATTQQQSTNTNNATTQQQSTTTTSQATNNTGTTTGTQQAATSQQTQPSYTTSNSQQSSVSQTASTASNQSYVSTQGKAVAKSSTGGTTSTEANQPQASKVDASTSSTPAQTTDTTDSSDQTQAQSTSTSSNQTTTNQTSATTATSSTDTQAAATDKSNVTTNSDGSISQSQQQNVNASDAYNTVLSRTKIKQGSATKGDVSTPVPSASDPQTTYQKYASQQDTTTTGQTSETSQSGSSASTSTTTSNNQSSQATTTPTTAQANSNGTANAAAESQNSSTTSATSTTTADSNNTSEQNSEGEAIFNAVKKNVSDQTSTWASVNEQGEIIKAYPWILKDIASKMAANQDTKGQVWKYAVPLTTGKTALVTIDGRSSTSKADEGTLAASMPALLKSIGSSSKTGMFDEAVDVDILKQSDYYKNLQTEQDNLKNVSAKDAYNAVLSSTTFTQDNGTLNTSKYVTAPTPNASDPKATYAKLAAEQQNGSNSSTTTTEDSDGTVIYNNIKTQVTNQTQSWADATEQGEIVKDYPWILNDIAKRMAVAGTDDNQVWNYKIPLTTGKTALITINGQPDVTSPSSLTASMPQLLKSLGSSATPDMFDDVVDSDILQNSHYYKGLQEQSEQQSSASSGSSGGSGIFGSLLGGSLFNPISIISGLFSAVQTVTTLGTLGVIPVVVSAVSSVTNIINTTNSLISIAQKVVPIVAPMFIIPAIATIAGIVINLPLIIFGLTIAKPVLDTIGTVLTIGGIMTTINTVKAIGQIVSTIGTIGSVVALGATLGAIGAAATAGVLMSAILPVIFKTISNIANAAGFLTKAVAFITGLVLGTGNAITSAISVLGKVIFSIPSLGTVVSTLNTALTVAASLAFSVLAGAIANLNTGFENVPFLAGFAIGASLVSLILTALSRQLFNSATTAINKFIQGAKNVLDVLALGSIVPAFVLAPTLIKIAMAFLALIPLAGWALKKFFDNIKAGLNTLKQLVNTVAIALPLTVINTAIASTVAKVINNAGSLVSTTLGPLAVRLVVGALTLATLPITFMLIGLPFVFINITNRLFKDLVTGTVKLVADVSALAANVVTNIESQIQQVIKTVVTPVVGGVNFLSSLLFIIPALTGIKYLTFPLAAILSIPLSVLANILVPGIATNAAKVIIPAITGLLFIPTLVANISGSRILTYFLGLPVALLLGNTFGNLLGQIVGTLTTALRNGVRGLINLLISPLSFISGILGFIPVVNILTAPLRLGVSILTLGNNIQNAINPIVDAVTSGINSLIARLLFAPVALGGIFLFGLPTMVNLNGLPILISSIGKTISSLSSLNTKIISGITNAIQNGLKQFSFNTFLTQTLRSLLGLPILVLTSPIWIGLPSLNLVVNTLSNVVIPILKFVNNSLLLPALQLISKVAAPIIADILTFIPSLFGLVNALKSAFNTLITVGIPQLIGAFVLPQLLIGGLSTLGGLINTFVQLAGVGILNVINGLLYNVANVIVKIALGIASLFTTLNGIGDVANTVSGLLFGIPALLAIVSAGTLLTLPLASLLTSVINGLVTKVVLPLISGLLTNPLTILLSTIKNTLNDLAKISNPILKGLLFLPTLLFDALKTIVGNNLLGILLNGLGNVLNALSSLPLILKAITSGITLGVLAITNPLWIGLPLLNLIRVILSDVVLPLLQLVNTITFPGQLVSTLWNVLVAPLLKTLPAQIIVGLIATIVGLPLGILGALAGLIFSFALPNLVAGVITFLTQLPANLLSGLLSVIGTVMTILGTITDLGSTLAALGKVILTGIGNLLNPLNGLFNNALFNGLLTLARDFGRIVSDLLFKLPIQNLLNMIFPAIVQFGTNLVLPVLSGLVGLPISMLLGTVFNRLVSSVFNLPLLLLGNDLLSWLPGLLAGAIVQIGSLLKNLIPTILGAIALFGLPAVLLPLELLGSLLLGLLLPLGLKWLAVLPVVLPALITLGSQIKWVFDAIKDLLDTISATIKAVVSTHNFLTGITTLPTIISAVLNTIFGFNPLNIIGDLINSLNKINWNNFIIPQIVSFTVKTIANVITNILNTISNTISSIITNILNGLFHLQGISGLLGLLFDIPASILQGIFNNIVPDVLGALAGLLVLAFNLLISTPLTLITSIAAILGRLLLTGLLNPVLQFGIDLISWIPALIAGTVVNILNLINGLLTQGPIGLFLFGLPLLLNVGLLFANLLAIPGFILNLISNFFSLPNLLSAIFPLIAALLLGAGLTLMSGITTALNVVSLIGQLVISLLTAPLWIGIPALNLLRQITFWTTAILGLPQVILSFFGNSISNLIKAVWNGLISLPQALLKLAASLFTNVFGNLAKDVLSAIGADILGLLVLGGLNLAGNVIKTLLQLAQFFLVTLPLTIGGLILSILALSLINNLIVSGLKGLLNSLLNGLVSTITKALNALPGLAAQFIANTIGTFTLAAVLTLNLFLGLQKLGNRLVMSFILGFLNLLNSVVKAVAGLPTLLGVIGTVVAAILPVPGHLLIAAILGALTLASLIAKLATLPLGLLTTVLNFIDNINKFFNFVSTIAGLIGAVIISQIVSGLAKLLLSPLSALAGLITGLIGNVLNAIKGIVETIVPLVLGALGLIAAIALPVIGLIIKIVSSILKDNPLLALFLLALPGLLIPTLDATMLKQVLSAISGIFKALWNLITNPLGTILDAIKTLISNILNPFSQANILKTIFGILGTVLSLPIVIGLANILTTIQNIFNSPLKFIGNLIGSVISSIVSGLVRLIGNGLSLAGLKLLTDLLPKALLALLTFLIPVVNIFTVGAAISAALNDIPLAILEKLASDLISGLVGNLVKVLLNVLGNVISALATFIGSFTVFLPIAGILIFTLVPASLILLWFFGPILFQLMVDPVADLVAFMVLQYTMFNHTIFYLAFFWIFEPLTFLTFIGAFVNWLNPLNELFNAVSSFAKNLLPTLTNLGLLVINAVALNTVLKGGVLGLPGAFGLFGAALGLELLIGLYSLVDLIPIAGLWATVILLVGLVVIVGVLGVVANLGINVPTFLAFNISVPFLTALSIYVVLVGMQLDLMIDGFATALLLPLITSQLAFGLFTSFFADPIFTLFANAAFAAIGFAGLLALPAGLIMLAHDWLPNTFNIPTFIYYLIMTNPVWTIGNWTGLVPIIGWIPAIIDDIAYYLIGAWGTGILASFNFTGWLLTNIPLVFSAVVPLSMLFALGSTAFLLAPIGLIGGGLIALINAIGPIINAIQGFFGHLVTGISAVLVLVWFLAPIAVQLMVNPVADFIAFMILQYTMFNFPIFYLAFFYISEPLTLLTFIGSFTNWLNPLNSLFDGISSFAKNILPTLKNAALNLLSGLSLNTFLKGGLLGLVGAGLLNSAKSDLQGLVNFFGSSTLLPNILVLAAAIGWALIVVVVGILGVVANLGINVPTWLSFEVALPAGVMLAITGGLIGVVTMLANDISKVFSTLPGVMTKLAFGSLIAFISDPIFTVLTQAGFAVIGVASVIALIAGAFMLAREWVPSTFNIPTFIYYLIMTNPVWTVGNWTGLVPIIGWIPAIIDDIGYYLIGAWGTGIFAALNFTSWLSKNIPLVFSAVVGIALGLSAILLAPIGLIGGVIVSLIAAIQPMLNAIGSFIGNLGIGFSAVVVLLWFLAPIALQLMVNPVADFVAFMILQYTMFNHPIFYLAFFYISEPLTLLTFIGSFTNWLNPLNSLFNGISTFAKNLLPNLQKAGMNLIGALAANTALRGGLLGLLGATLLNSAKSSLQSLINFFGSSTALPNLFIRAVVIGLVGIVVIVGILGVVANLGINVPTWLSFELAVPAYTMLTITAGLIGVVMMVNNDLSKVISTVPGIVLNLGLGSLIAFISDPIFTALAQAGFAVIGVASIIGLIAGAFMLAQDWLPSTFNIPTFIYYLIMTNPVWTVGNWTGLVPIIGWIPAIIDDIGYYLIGAWGTGILTAFNFTSWLTKNIPLVFSAVVGISMLLSLGLGGILLAPIGLIGGVIVSIIAAVQPLINAVKSFVGNLGLGFSAVILLIWFFAPIALQLMVNPVADFVAFMILQYTMFNHPIFYLAFFYISEPLTLLTFIGTFTNWLNPLNSLFNGISTFAKNFLPQLQKAGMNLIGALAANTALRGGLLGLVGAWLLNNAKSSLQSLINTFASNTGLPNLMLWAVVIGLVGIVVIVGVLGVVANLGINVPTWLSFELAVPAYTMLSITVTLVGLALMLNNDISKILSTVPGIVMNLGLGSLIAFFSDPIFTVLAQAGFAVIGVASIIGLIAGAFMLAQDWLPSTFNIPTFIYYLVMTNPIWTIGNFTGLIPIIGWIPAIIDDIGYYLLGAWGTGILATINFTSWLSKNIPLVFSAVIGISMLLSLGLGGILLAPVGLIGGVIVSIIAAIQPLFNTVTGFIGGILPGLASVLTLTWFLAPIALQLMVNPFADFTGFLILLYTMVNHPIFYLAFFYISEPLMILIFIGSLSNLANPINWVFNGISLFSKVALPITEFVAFLLAAGIGINTILKGGLLGLAGGLSIFGALLDSIGLSITYTINTLIPNLALWAVVILWAGLLVIIGTLGVVINLGINVPTWLSFEITLPAGVMLAITAALVGIVAMLVLDANAFMTTLPGVMLKFGFGMLTSLLVDPIFTILGAVGLTITGIVSLIATLAGAFMLAQDWLPSTFNILTFIFYLIMTNPVWTVGNWAGLVPIIGWIPAIITDIGYYLIGAWGTGILATLNFTTWLTTTLPMVLSGVGPILFMLATGLGLPLITPLILTLAVGLLIIPLFIIIPITNPNMIPTLLFAGLVKALTGTVSNLVGNIVSGLVKLFNSFPLDNLLVSLLTKLIGSPKGLLQTLLSLPLTILKSILQLASGINAALSVVWGLNDLLRSVFGSIIPSFIFGAVGGLLGIGNLLPNILNSLAILTIANLLNLINPLNWLFNGLATLAISVVSSIANGIKSALNNLGSLLSNLIQLGLPLLNLIRLVGIAGAGLRLIGSLIDLLTTPLKLLFNFIKDVALPFLAISTIANIVNTALRLLSMPLLLLVIPLLAVLLSGGIINALAAILTPLAILAIAAALPLLLNAISGLFRLVPDILNLVLTGLVNGMTNLLKSLVSNNALLKSLLNFMQNLFNGGSWITNGFDKIMQLAMDILGPLAAPILLLLKGLGDLIGTILPILGLIGSLLLPIPVVNVLLALNFLPEAIGALLGAVSKIGDLLKNLGNMVLLPIASLILAGLGLLLSPVLSIIMTPIIKLLLTLPVIGGLIGLLANIDSVLTKNVLPLLGTLLSTLISNILKAVTADIPGLVKSFFNVLGKAAQLLLIALPDLLIPNLSKTLWTMFTNGLNNVVKSLVGLPYNLLIQPVINMFVNTIVPIAAFIGLSLLHTLLNPISSILGFFKSVIDTINAQNKLNGVLKNIVNSATSVLKGLQTLWLIGLALGTLVSQLISMAVAILTHLITSGLGKLLLNLAGLSFIIFGSNPLKTIGSVITNVGKMWNSLQTVPKVIKGIVQGLMKIGSTFTYFIRGIKHLGDLLVGFAVAPGALGVLGLVRQVVQKAVAAPLQWLMNNIVLPLITNVVTGLGLTIIAPIAFLVNLVVSLPGNTIGRLILTVPLALLGNSFAQWLPAIALAGFGTLLPSIIANAIKLGLTGIPLFGLVIPAILGTILKGLLIPTNLKWIANLPGLLGQIGSWLLLPFGVASRILCK